jgi:hypothetical protein
MKPDQLKARFPSIDLRQYRIADLSTLLLESGSP